MFNMLLKTNILIFVRNPSKENYGYKEPKIKKMLGWVSVVLRN